MFKIEYSPIATEQINEIYDNSQIYNGKNFTQKFLKWNSEFHHYVGKETLSKLNLPEQGVYDIGTIGKLNYFHFTLEDGEIFVILEFRFSKLPYSTQKTKRKIVKDAGYGYKIVQSFPDEKCAILSPKNKYLTNFAFDNIIGFHHSIDDYNKVYAVGFIKDRVFAIYPNSDIEVLPYSKDEYLKNKHRYDESVKFYKMIIIRFF